MTEYVDFVKSTFDKIDITYTYIYSIHTGQQGILVLARISSSFEQKFTPSDVIVTFGKCGNRPN